MKGNNIATVAMIAAMAKNRIIGSHGKIPWDLPEDREHFKQLTMGQVVIMGRRSYEEIGKPLPGRVTYVISSTMTAEGKEFHTMPSLAAAIEHAEKSYPHKKIFLCGGARIYEEGMNLAKEIYLTVLDEEVEGDTYFPKMKESFHIVDRKQQERCTFFVYLAE